MQSIGRKLKRQRLLRQISLEQLAEYTKIPVASLALMEDGKFSELPNEIVVKGFLKSVCSILELDVKDIIDEYLSKHGSKTQNKTALSPISNISHTTKHSTGKFRILIALLIFLILGSLLLAIVFAPATMRGNNNPQPSEKISVEQGN